MTVYKETIQLESHGGTPSFINITDSVRTAIKNSGVQNGTCTVISPHTTCSVFFEEFVHDFTEDGTTEFLQADLNDALKKIIPDEVELGQYRYPGDKHFEDVFTWPDWESWIPGGDKTQLLNCDAHLKATLLGSSAIFDVDDGQLGVGKTGYVYFVDFDRTRARSRKCKIIIMGE
ncbi:MAG: YjbQ family protein [Eubacterium aggregans]|jgi:thiamine phosphate synthase YjbQ (UPF0047 family)|uniref:Thiamin phosphate synthase YjbQ, UPF0047 family n=1 Tax=Eubacterium aggregans TaxID=81409 RepID=A0A1H4DNE5_9FIRM|nr:YjbQ family protein [Eubacterium aggregans]MDD4692642.1 YjbQ family protein [Eubacterium aggregans]MEA5074505.1 YjbQ family protein [Eubacterium aggregans]SEA74275.1 Thiamin phosphate synthase YjbQ, UPF0047 family [Eubacterium aggregans]